MEILSLCLNIGMPFKAWSIIKQYLNAPLNEIYTCYKLCNDNRIYPTVVFRQIPFTTQDFQTRFLSPPVTPPAFTTFLTVPRWQIDSSLVYSLDIGRDEVARVNFVQYYSRVGLINDNAGAGPAQEIAAIIMCLIRRCNEVGLDHPLFPVCLTRLRSIKSRSPIWAKIVGDSVIGSQLKLNGTMELVGISSANLYRR